MYLMPDVLSFLEYKTKEMDKFVDEVDCGDDWFIIYGSELSGLRKILKYAEKQIGIQSKFEASMKNKSDFGKE